MENEIEIFNMVKGAIQYAELNGIKVEIRWDSVRVNDLPEKIATAEGIYCYVNGVIDGRKANATSNESSHL